MNGFVDKLKQQALIAIIAILSNAGTAFYATRVATEKMTVHIEYIRQDLARIDGKAEKAHDRINQYHGGN